MAYLNSWQHVINQQIENSHFYSPGSLVSWMGAIQGQDFTGAKWSIGLRLSKATNNDIEEAFAARELARTWLMRGTLHIVAFADIHWMLKLLAPRIISAMAGRYRSLELDEATLQRSGDILTNALLSGISLSRNELFSILEQHNISTKGQRGVHLLQRASLDSLIFQSGIIKNTAYFMLLNPSKTANQGLTREEALAKLAQRYFKSRGPATLKDFAWWSGLTMAEVKKGVESIKSALVTETINGEIYLKYAQDADYNHMSHRVHLLPGFDEFLLGYKNREDSLDPQFQERWCPGNNGMFLPFLVVDGRVNGIWKRTLTKGKIKIDIRPFLPLNKNRTGEIAEAAKQYCNFMELPLQEIIIT